MAAVTGVAAAHLTQSAGCSAHVFVMRRSPSIVPGTTTAAKLLARKQMLLDRLEKDPGPNERAEIDRLIAEIDHALSWLEEAGYDVGQ